MRYLLILLLLCQTAYADEIKVKCSDTSFGKCWEWTVTGLNNKDNLKEIQELKQHVELLAGAIQKLNEVDLYINDVVNESKKESSQGKIPQQNHQ